MLAFSLGAHSSRESISRRIMVAVLSQPSTVISRAQSGGESGDDGDLFFRCTGVLAMALSRVDGNGYKSSPTSQEMRQAFLPFIILCPPWRRAFQSKVRVKVLECVGVFCRGQ